MTSLWLPSDQVKIRKYSVAGNGGGAVVRIELEVSDPMRLGYLLTEIAEVKARIELERKKKAQAERDEKRRAKEKPAIGRKKMLALPFYGDEQS